MSVMVKNKINKNYKRSQRGRSMVEMLGVLAIVGVLSVGGVYGYGVAMKKHKANELLHQASMLAATISAQALTNDGKLPETITSFGNSSYGTFSTSTTDALGGKGFTITIENVDSAVCDQLKTGGMIQGVNCVDSATSGKKDAKITYYKNLATTEAEGKNSPTGEAALEGNDVKKEIACFYPSARLGDVDCRPIMTVYDRYVCEGGDRDPYSYGWVLDGTVDSCTKELDPTLPVPDCSNPPAFIGTRRCETGHLDQYVLYICGNNGWEEGNESGYSDKECSVEIEIKETKNCSSPDGIEGAQQCVPSTRLSGEYDKLICTDGQWVISDHTYLRSDCSW